MDQSLIQIVIQNPWYSVVRAVKCGSCSQPNAVGLLSELLHWKRLSSTANRGISPKTDDLRNRRLEVRILWGVLDLRRLATLMVQNYSVSCSSLIGLANTDNLLSVNDLSHFLSLEPRGC